MGSSIANAGLSQDASHICSVSDDLSRFVIYVVQSDLLICCGVSIRHETDIESRIAPSLGHKTNMISGMVWQGERSRRGLFCCVGAGTVTRSWICTYTCTCNCHPNPDWILRGSRSQEHQLNLVWLRIVRWLFVWPGAGTLVNLPPKFVVTPGENRRQLRVHHERTLRIEDVIPDPKKVLLSATSPISAYNCQ